VSEPASGSPRYRVAYSGRVRDDLRRLAAKAKACGLGVPFLTTLREIDRRLHVYPQFGEPLYDLKRESAQAWIATVPPLVVKYVIDEDARAVLVARPFSPLPYSGL
jgi:hypothetical protein